MDHFHLAQYTYVHLEWKEVNGKVLMQGDRSPQGKFIFYHYTAKDPAKFIGDEVKINSFWCSFKTSDRNLIHEGTGIGVYTNRPMWRIELSFASAQDCIDAGVLGGGMRWEPKGFPSIEYEFRTPIPLSSCKVVLI